MFIFLACALGANVDVDIDASKVLHQANPMYMGCHSDSGFVHEVTGWSSQMIFGESFEMPPNKTQSGQSSYAWNTVIDSTLGSRAKVQLDNVTAFSGQASQRITIAAGAAAGTAGLANRGLGNEGLYIQAGKEYEGYFFASSKTAVELEVRLETTDGKKVLASQRFSNPGTGAFVQHTFSLTPAVGTECVGIAPGSDPTVHCTNNPGTAHVCIKCGGQITFALVAAKEDATANIDYAVLQPGQWGRVQGQNARKDVFDTLSSMGIKIIRLGGSFCSVGSNDGEYYQWQKWTGPVWKRPSIGAHWDSYGGTAYNLIGGWGPFEMIDYAVALGAEPVITTTRTSTPESFADLVEYCWANSSMPMGKQRVADGHPEPYRLKYIELGNEEYNTNYVEQVIAMEARANAVGIPNQLHYMFPDNGGLNAADAAKAAALKLGKRLVTDLHVGAGGALPVADQLFAAHAKAGLMDDAAVNFETNAATHNAARSLDEAADLNDFFNAGNPRMLARTASFCHGRAGHFDMFDQAISYFMPNMTWLQPPGYVHAMITSSWQPNVVNSTVTAHAAAPVWSTHVNKSLTCAGSEYQGDLGVMATADMCLAAAQKRDVQSPGTVNFALYFASPNKNCYACLIPGDPSTWKLTDTKGATSFEGTNIVAPFSVSSQQSDDKKTLVVRIVNHGAAQTANIKLQGFVAASATAVSMASDDPNAENSAATPTHVSPRPLSTFTIKGTSGTITVPTHSFTVVTLLSEAKGR